MRRKGWFRRAKLKWAQQRVYSFKCLDSFSYAFEQIEAEHGNISYKSYYFQHPAKALAFAELFWWCRRWYRTQMKEFVANRSRRKPCFWVVTTAEHRALIAY